MNGRYYRYSLRKESKLLPAFSSVCIYLVQKLSAYHFKSTLQMVIAQAKRLMLLNIEILTYRTPCFHTLVSREINCVQYKKEFFLAGDEIILLKCIVQHEQL